jgi:sarcosine oxidase subunit beta
MPRDADVIIVGAGSVGLPAAMAMAQAGLRVLVLDSRTGPGQGSHKTAIGGARATHSDPAKIRLCARSLEILSGWQDTYGDDIEWRTGGYVFVAYRELEARQLRALLPGQHRQGLAIEWLDATELLRVAPDLNPAGLMGGTYSPGDGHCSPLLAGIAMERQAIRAGATFRFGEEVAELITDRGRAAGVRTTRGEYLAPVVVNAAGAWAGDLANAYGEPLPLVPDAHEAGITEPLARFLEPMIVDLRPAPGTASCYFYQLPTGQVIFCVTPNPPIIGTDARETSNFLPQVARRLVSLVPRLAGARVRRTWRGTYPMTPDGSPIVGWSTAVPGLLLAVGMCGQGFMLGPGLGELLARVVCEHLEPEDHSILQAFSPNRQFAGQEALR